MTYPYTYTCVGCGKGLDPYELYEFGHVCDGWWDEHGIFDALPKINVAAKPEHHPTDPVQGYTNRSQPNG